MSKQKTTGKTVQTRTARAATANRLDTEAISNEGEAWDFVQKFFPDAITAIAEYAYMYDLCAAYVLDGREERKEARRLANVIGDECYRANGGQALTLTYCWREEPEMFETGYLPADLRAGLGSLRNDAPASFAAIERLDALLPTAIGFPKAPRFFSPAALFRCCIASLNGKAFAA